MNLLTSIFSSGVDKVVDSVANGLDELLTSDDERNAAKIALEKVKNEARLKEKELSVEFEKEITKRWYLTMITYSQD